MFIPRREIVYPPKIENSIAFISFENLTGEKSYDKFQKVIPNLLIDYLENSGNFSVTTWEQMRDLLKQMGKEDVEFVDTDLGLEFCRMGGIGALAVGSYSKAGDLFVTDVKILDVETKQLIDSVVARGIGEQSILGTQISELGREISLGLGITKDKIDEAQPRILSASLEAYDYFIKGNEEYNNYYFEESRESLEKAVELDPTFAMAYLYLADVYTTFNNVDARNEAVKKAKLSAVGAPEKVKLYAEATYAFDIQKDLDKGIYFLQKLVNKYPKEKRAYVNLGQIYRRTRSYSDSIDAFLKAIQLDKTFGLALNGLAYVYMDLKNYDKALEYLYQYLHYSPDIPTPLDSLAELYFRLGRIEEALATYGEVLKKYPDWGEVFKSISYVNAFEEDYLEAIINIDKFIAHLSSSDNRRRGYMMKGFYQAWLGNLDLSIITLNEYEEVCEKAGMRIGQGFSNFMKAWIYYDRGELELSRECNNGWLDLFIEIYPGLKAYMITYNKVIDGLIDLKEGHNDMAKKRLAEINPIFPTEDNFYAQWEAYLYNFLHAEISLVEDHSEKAVEAFEKIVSVHSPNPSDTSSVIEYNTPFQRDILARAYQQMGEIDKAIAEYEKLTGFDPKSEDRRLIHPKYYYRLGRLYERKGWPGKAIENYEKFLDLWKDADPGIDEMEDARKRLAGLKGRIA
jgi:tetratricopeptide (TPR) repeat protein